MLFTSSVNKSLSLICCEEIFEMRLLFLLMSALHNLEKKILKSSVEEVLYFRSFA